MAKSKLLLYLFLCILTGILLWLAWPPKHLTILIFFAFVPLLLAGKFISEEKEHNTSLRLFLFTFSTFVIWNFLSTFWIRYATFSGAIMTVILNALLMTFPFMLYHKVRYFAGKNMAYMALPLFWIGFEYFHLNWDLSWPWMSLGNAFATKISWIQWYEYTGILGGTLWIWIINLSVFRTLEYFIDNGYQFKQKRIFFIGISSLLVWFLIPCIISKSIKIEESRFTGKNVVIVQPNIDPYNEKFEEDSYQKQINKLIDLSESAIDKNTILVVWPETAITNSIDEATLNTNSVILYIRSFIRKYPRLKLLTGLDSYKFFTKGEKISPTARLYLPDSQYYDNHNSALMLDSSSEFQLYYKSRLVPGVEKMPYPKFFKFIEKYAINLGGTSGSLGKQDKPTVFVINTQIIAAPAICYESVYGDHLGNFVMAGANVIVIMTNDGWWRNTDGHKQHFDYAALRAIELRKDIIRSANTGISGYFNAKGEIIARTKYWEPAVIKKNLKINNTLTFYARYGDYLGIIASMLSGIIILWGLLMWVNGRKK